MSLSSFSKIFLGTTLVFTSKLSGADPSPKNNFEALKQHGTAPEANELWQKIVEAEMKIRNLLTKFSKAKIIEPKQLSELMLAHDDIRYWNLRLQDLGEPAAIDFELRRNFYNKQVLALYNTWLGQPNSAATRQNVIAQLTKTQPKRLQSYAAINKRLESGDVTGAEVAIDSARNDLYSLLNVLALTERPPFDQPFLAVKGQVDLAAQSRRQQTAAEAFREKVASDDRDIKEGVRKVDGLIESIRQTGGGIVDDKPATIPESLKHIIDQWKKAHARIQSSAAVDRIPLRQGEYSESSDASSGNDDRWMTRALELDQVYRLRVNRFLEVTSASVNGENARSTYVQLLEVLADLDSRLKDDAWTDATQQSLKELARKGGFNAEVENYHNATTELLRWKERFAEACAALIKSHGNLVDVARSKLTIGAQQSIGMYSSEPNEPGRPRILSPIPDLVPAISKSLGEARVVARAVRPLDSPSKLWMSRIDSGLYCLVTGSPDVLIKNDDVRILEKALLVDEKHPPMSLRAMTALHTANNGIYEACGCTLEDFAIEGATTRFALFRENAGTLIPLGQVHPRGELGELNYLLVRFLTKPDWFHHRYFVATRSDKNGRD